MPTPHAEVTVQVGNASIYLSSIRIYTMWQETRAKLKTHILHIILR